MSAETTGWDFGAVEAFKGIFRKGAKVIQEQTVGRAQNALMGCGVELSDEAAGDLASHVLKIGESCLCPIPAEELVLNLDVKKISTTASGYAVTLDGVALRGAEVWLYNFSTWEGPTVQVGSLVIGSVQITGNGFSLRGSMALKKLKLQADAGNVLGIVATVCADSMNTVVDADLAQGDGGQQSLIEIAQSAPVKKHFADLVRAQLGTALKAGVMAELDSLEVTVAEITVDGVGKGKAKVAVKGLKGGAKVEEGRVEVSPPGGSVEVALTGRLSKSFGLLKVMATVTAAKAGASLDAEVLAIEKLAARVRITGQLGGKALVVKASIDAEDLAVKVTTNSDALLELLCEAASGGLSDAFEAATSDDPDVNDPVTVKGVLEASVGDRIKGALRTQLTANLSAVIGKLEVVIGELTYDTATVSGTVTARDVRASVDVAPGTAPHVEIEGDIAAHDLLIQAGGEQLLQVISVDANLDDTGTGAVTGSFILKGKGIAHLADSTVLKLLMKKSDPLVFDVPIRAYMVVLGGIKVKMPKHKLITKALQVFVLSNVRVSDEEYGGNIFRKTKKTAPKLKVSVLKSRQVDVSEGDLGVTPEQTAREPVLVPRQESGGQGAVNLQAFLEHNLQSQISALLS